MTQEIIIAISLILGVISGIVMHRADFCLAGMFRDLFLFHRSPQLRSLVLLIAVSMLLFELARLLGLLNYSFPSSMFGLPSLANLFGGILLGVGMVLAGGCVVGTLHKLGSGNLPAAYTLFGLLAGSTIYAEVHPLWKELAVATRLSESSATLPQLLGLPTTAGILIILLCLATLLYRWWKADQFKQTSVVNGTLQPSTAALVLAIVGLISLVTLGMPLGITTSYAKAGAFFEQLLIPEHVASLGYFQGRGFQYFSPLSQQTLSAGAGPFLDGLSLVQFPLIVGILLGAFLSALTLGKFQFSRNIPKAQLVSALLGGLMMGLAARMAPACNVWHLLGGLPLLSLQSLLFTLGLFPGAWIGSRLLTRYVIK